MAVFAQPGLAPRPVFEIVSVKVNRSNDPRTFRIDALAGGRFHATNAPVKRVLTIAYGVEYSQILSGPGWLESDGYDFDAKVDGTPPRERYLLMLQSLLEDRFQMTVRRETRAVPVYALV